MATRNSNKNVKAQTDITEAVAEEVKPTRVSAPKKRQKLPDDMLVECKNITMGRLIYISNRQLGYKIIWSEPGDVEDIELKELMSMRNSQPRFFTENWIGIEDPEILKYLGVEKYYEGVPSFEDYENILTLPFEEMKLAVSKLPKGVREHIGIKATDLINNGTIDSMKTIKYLCEAFDLTVDE